MLGTPLLELIDLIYAAALHAELWPKALIRLADITRSECPVLMLFEPSYRRMAGFAPRTDPAVTRAYAEYWNHRNPLEKATRTHPVFDIASPETVMGAREFAKTPIFNEWWRPSGLGTAALETNLMFDGAFPTILNINRKYGADDYSGEDVAVFALAARHVARAVEVGRVVSGAGLGVEAMVSMLDRRGENVILVDHRARILFASRAARKMIAAGDALRLNGPSLAIAGRPGVLERLVASCRPVESVLGSGGSVSVRRLGRRPIKLTVAPVGPALSADAAPWLDAIPATAPTAVITISEPEAKRERNLEAWRGRFGLTPAEARFALEIIDGGGRRAAARRFGVSDSTARTHLTNIFDKTGVSRQAELVALLLGSG